MDLLRLRKRAGIKLTEAEEKQLEKTKKGDASPQHKENEHALFKKACEDLSRVETMCAERLKSSGLSDEHKKQYKDLHECAKRCCEDMRKHLASYK